MKFIDEAIIEVSSGKGGAGSVSFRREKFVPMGGPDGGDGGKGGSIIIKATKNKQTLLDFKFNPIWKAEDGASGEGRLKTGKDGQDLTILVPIGTIVLDLKTKEKVCDLSSDEETFILAKGGRGGKGNNFFKSSTNQAPEHAQKGEAAVSGKFLLNLKLVADVGIIGLPNAGKSTLISKLSSAKPKIADYPFTTLTPNLGVLRAKGKNIVLADIPGLIPEASTGKGLGIKFLKHIERTKILLHLIDPLYFDEMGNQIAPLEAFNAINKELAIYSKILSTKKQVVTISKSELITDEEIKIEIRKNFKNLEIDVLFISSVTGLGLEELVGILESNL